MTSEDKIANVEKQLRAIRRNPIPGVLDVIHCPYCGDENTEGQELCCNLLRKAMAAVVIKFKSEDDVEFFQRIQEGVARQAKHARN